jgi:hypothetical protein
LLKGQASSRGFLERDCARNTRRSNSKAEGAERLLVAHTLRLVLRTQPRSSGFAGKRFVTSMRGIQVVVAFQQPDRDSRSTSVAARRLIASLGMFFSNPFME